MNKSLIILAITLIGYIASCDNDLSVTIHDCIQFTEETSSTEPVKICFYKMRTFILLLAFL